MRRGSYDEAAASFRPHLRSLAQRRRSAPSLVFGRALGIPWNPIREEAAVAVEQCPFVLGLSSDGSPLALDECVQVTEGPKTRDRHLFLFNQELIIAKLKSTASYRLKHRLNLVELWVYSCDDDDDDDDDEDNKDEEESEELEDVELRASLVLVWPQAFCVVTFCSPEVKDVWSNTLHRKIIESHKRLGSSSPPPSTLMKVLSSSGMTKTLTAGGVEEDMEEPSQDNAKGPTPQRQLCNKEEASKQPIGQSGGHGSKLTLSLARRLRGSSKHSSSSSSSSFPNAATGDGQLFGRPLYTLCSEDGALPRPIMEIVQLLWRKGPNVEGVFRKAGNQGKLNAVRKQLDLGGHVSMEALQVVELVGLLKSFLKELPGSLLVADKYNQWISAMETEDHLRLTHVKRVIDSLPEANALLLKCLLCVLHRISQSSEVNKMDGSNLAVCISPTLLPQTGRLPKDAQAQAQEVKKVTGLTQYLIENCCSVFGDDILVMLGEPDEEELATDTSESTSSHQHDSAYDSTDPDGDCDSGEVSLSEDREACPCGGAMARRSERSIVASCSSDAIFSTFTKPLNRRCSEPAIFPSTMATGTYAASLRGQARSHDDFSTHCHGAGADFPELTKQTSDDSFLLSRRDMQRLVQPSLLNTLGGSLPGDLLPLRPATSAAGSVPRRRTSKDCSCSSSCSLESAASNMSDGSVFTSSPLASPTSTRKSHSTRLLSASAITSSSSTSTATANSSFFRRTQSVSCSKIDGPQTEQARVVGAEPVCRSKSMRSKVGGLFNRASFKRNSRGAEPQTEGSAFPCGPLHEDSQSEAENPEGNASEHGEGPIQCRPRPLSAIEVFQQVDSRLPGAPPSYDQALLSSAHPGPPPQYSRRMTVRDALEMDRRSRPQSMNEDFLLNSTGYDARCPDYAMARGEYPAPMPTSIPTFRARAMSESVSRSRQEVLARRCSQPLFEELSYPKESYV